VPTYSSHETRAAQPKRPLPSVTSPHTRSPFARRKSVRRARCEMRARLSCPSARSGNCSHIHRLNSSGPCTIARLRSDSRGVTRGLAGTPMLPAFAPNPPAFWLGRYRACFQLRKVAIQSRMGAPPFVQSLPWPFCQNQSASETGIPSSSQNESTCSRDAGARLLSFLSFLSLPSSISSPRCRSRVGSRSLLRRLSCGAASGAQRKITLFPCRFSRRIIPSRSSTSRNRETLEFDHRQRSQR